MHPRIPLFQFSSSFICAAVSIASWKVKFSENVGNI